MKIFIQVLILALFVFSRISTFGMSPVWHDRLKHKLQINKKIRDQLRNLSINELKILIERVKVFELKQRQEMARINRERDEKKRKMHEKEMQKQRKMLSYFEAHFGSSNVLKDFFSDRMMK
jgi:hypothetical protein